MRHDFGFRLSLPLTLALPALVAGCIQPFPPADPYGAAVVLLTAQVTTTGSSAAGSPGLTLRVADNGVLESGTLIGTSAGAASISVSLNGGAYQTATGSGSWSFALPIAWRRGTSRTVAVRATAADGTTTELTRTIRRGLNRDFNGDGYPDLAIGAPDNSGSTGRVYLFAGSSAVSSAAAASAGTILSGDGGGHAFGTASFAGDFNGDGYGDLAVGAHSNGLGAVYVFHGSSAGIAGGTAGTVKSAQLNGEAAADLFGVALASGDVNGDGYDDLIVGARSSGTPGRAYVFHGSPSGIADGTNAAAADAILIGEAAGTNFGISVHAGDVNGDGYADVAVGDQDFNGTQGRAYLFHGASSGVTGGGAGGANTILTGDTAPAANSRLGAQVRIADVNGDGFGDFLAAAPDYNSQQGRLYLFHGAGGGIASGGATARNAELTGEGTGQRFANYLHAGDLNGDGYDDVGVGAYLFSSSTGRAYVFHGSASGVTTVGAAAAATVLDGETGGSEFAQIRCGDYNGDGVQDLLVGAPVYGSSTGRVYFFAGAGAGIGGGNAGIAASAIWQGESTSNSFGFF